MLRKECENVLAKKCQSYLVKVSKGKIAMLFPSVIFGELLLSCNMSRVKLSPRASVSLVTSGQDDYISSEDRRGGWGGVL